LKEKGNYSQCRGHALEAKDILEYYLQKDKLPTALNRIAESYRFE